MQSTETWRPIPGYEGAYEASDHGRIRSLPPTGRHSRRHGIVLKPSPRPDSGHLRVVLIAGGKRRTRYVHDLVLRSFVGAPPEGTEACHGDGNESNNHLSNLRWGTHQSNIIDEVLHGTHANASKTVCPRDHDLVEPNLIRSQLAKGFRSCRACAQAKAFAQYHGEQFSAAIADEKYARIMHD